MIDVSKLVDGKNYKVKSKDGSVATCSWMDIQSCFRSRINFIYLRNVQEVREIRKLVSFNQLPLVTKDSDL